MDILQRLYDSEINFQIETFWDSGFTVRLGDSLNGIKAEESVGTMEEALIWLHQQAIKYFPDSRYVKDGRLPAL